MHILFDVLFVVRLLGALVDLCDKDTKRECCQLENHRLKLILICVKVK
jgi:hypothetical protein